MKHAAHLCVRLPPIVMISFDHDFQAFHLTDAAKITKRVIHSHRPARIARYDQNVVVAPDSFPRFEDLLVVVMPMLAKPVHGFAGPALEVHIAYSENSH